MIDGGLRRIFRENIPNAHWSAIETGGTGRGVPDDNVCLNGVETWLEYKHTDGWAVRIRPEQVAWSERRTRAGGRVLLLTRRRCTPGPRRPAADELWIHRASDIRHVSLLGLRDGPRPLYKGEDGPSAWLWPVIEEIVFGPWSWLTPSEG